MKIIENYLPKIEFAIKQSMKQSHAILPLYYSEFIVRKLWIRRYELCSYSILITKLYNTSLSMSSDNVLRHIGFYKAGREV